MGIIRIAMLFGIGWAVYLVFRWFLSSQLGGKRKVEEKLSSGNLVKDPQCGVYVDVKSAVQKKTPGGEFFFCSEECAKLYLESDS